MRQSNRVGWMILAVLTVLVGIWFFTRRTSSPVDPRDASNRSTTHSSGTLSDPDSNKNHLAQSPTGTQRGQAPATIRVVDTRSKLIEGALISWTPARTDWIAGTVSETDRPWDEIESGSTFAQSGMNGVFELTFDARERAAVWISHPGHAARVFHNLSGGDLNLPDTIVLEDSTPMLARVEGEDAAPVANARVRQCYSLWDKPLDGVDPQYVAARLFQRIYKSSADGTVSLAGLRGYHCLIANADDQVSNLWTGIQPCEPLLTLRSTFTASGTVPVHADPKALKTRDRVLVTAYVDTGGEEIGYLNVREDGTWGPAQLPCRPASEYRYYLESEEWLGHLVRRPAPAPGELVRVDFPGEKGLTLRVQTVEKDGKPIEGVRVGMSTEFENTTITSLAYTNTEGEAVFRTFRPGALWVSTHKDGYEPLQRGRFDIHVEPNVPFRVELSPGGALRGRVMMDGKPARTFAVRMWNDEKRYSDDRHFQDRPDGTFEINDVPLGALSVVATSLPSARSEPVQVAIEPGKSSEVEIELSKGIVGTGMVIAASSGEPVRDARVQPHLMVPGRNFGAFGPMHACGPDGAFRIVGFGPGTNVALVSAPGFAAKRVVANSDSQGSIDFGWIALQRPGGLEVSLSVDRSEPLGEFSLELIPDESGARQRFNTEGRIHYKELSPGQYEAHIHLSRFRSIQAYFEVAPNAPTRWVVEHKPVRDLVVELVPPLGSDPPRGFGCSVGYVSPTGREEWFLTRFDDKLRCDLSCIPSDSMIVDIVSDQMESVTTRRIKSSRSAPQVVQIPLNVDPLYFRLLSQSGESVFPAWVQFNQVADGVNWSTAIPSDENGELTLKAVPAGPISVIVSAARHRKWIKELPTPTDRDMVLEIIIANDSFADLRALDGAVPLPGLTLQLTDPIGQNATFDTKSTSPEGRVRFDSLESQEFEVKVSEPGYWPTRLRFTPTASGTQLDMQVRRLGGARLHASIVGTPYRHKVISVRSVEFDTDVMDWLAAGRIQASSSKLETDDEGRLALDGLPNGVYRWSAKNSRDEWTSGEFTVPPRSTASVSVTLP